MHDDFRSAFAIILYVLLFIGAFFAFAPITAVWVDGFLVLFGLAIADVITAAEK